MAETDWVPTPDFTQCRSVALQRSNLAVPGFAGLALGCTCGFVTEDRETYAECHAEWVAHRNRMEVARRTPQGLR